MKLKNEHNYISVLCPIY